MDDLKKAKGYALRLFKLRPRSRAELRERLRLKGYTDEIIENVCVFFARTGELDDEAFARLWLQSRIHRYGYRRLSRELEGKGISRADSRRVFEEHLSGYDEVEAARALVVRRLRTSGRTDSIKQKKRLTDCLLRRGFSAESINEALKDI